MTERLAATYEVFRRHHALTARRRASEKIREEDRCDMQKLQQRRSRPQLTCACTSASLKRMNQLTENLPAFCSVRALLLLSQMRRR